MVFPKNGDPTYGPIFRGRFLEVSGSVFLKVTNVSFFVCFFLIFQEKCSFSWNPAVMKPI